MMELTPQIFTQKSVLDAWIDVTEKERHMRQVLRWHLRCRVLNSPPPMSKIKYTSI